MDKVCAIKPPMDLPTFVGIVVGIATLIATGIAWVKYRRGQTRVVVEATRNEFLLPPVVTEMFKRLEKVGFTLNSPAYHENSSLDLREFFTMLHDLSRTHRFMSFMTSKGSCPMWVFKVRNEGHETADKLELQVPYAEWNLIIQSNKSQDVVTGNTIRIPELRPGESMRIVSWVPYFGPPPTLLQPRGKATIQLNVSMYNLDDL